MKYFFTFFGTFKNLCGDYLREFNGKEYSAHRARHVFKLVIICGYLSVHCTLNNVH